MLDNIKLFENTPVVYISLRTHLAPVTLLELELEKKLELSHMVGKGCGWYLSEEPTTTLVYRQRRPLRH